MWLGKPDRRIMFDTVWKLAGATNRDIILGPTPGVDTSILKIGHGKVLISSSDPVSLIPTIGAEKSAELSVHSVASDVATSGTAPKFASFDLNLPPSMSDNVLKRYWHGIHSSCRRLGISILGGHTGRFEGCDYSVIGGATMFAIGDENSYVTSAMALNGDSLIETKSAALEAAAVLSTSFPGTVRKKLGHTVAVNTAELVNKISTVRDALAASSVELRKEGVTAMHDVTEGGVVSAVLDIANASGLKATVYKDRIPLYEDVGEVCSLFQINPLESLGHGSLLISSRPQRARDVVDELKKTGIDASVIGHLTRRGENTIISEHGKARIMTYPKQDPYWRVYWDSVRKRLT